MSTLIQNAIELPWGYIMSTLLIRFVGVFFVLAILMAGMYLLGLVVSRIVAKQEARKADRQKREAAAISLAEEPEREADEEEIIAAIGAALAMAMDAQQTVIAPSTQPDAMAGAWAMAGRASQMNLRMQGGTHRRS